MSTLASCHCTRRSRKHSGQATSKKEIITLDFLNRHRVQATPIRRRFVGASGSRWLSSEIAETPLDPDRRPTAATLEDAGMITSQADEDSTVFRGSAGYRL